MSLDVNVSNIFNSAAKVNALIQNGDISQSQYDDNLRSRLTVQEEALYDYVFHSSIADSILGGGYAGAGTHNFSQYFSSARENGIKSNLDGSVAIDSKDAMSCIMKTLLSWQQSKIKSGSDKSAYELVFQRKTHMFEIPPYSFSNKEMFSGVIDMSMCNQAPTSVGKAAFYRNTEITKVLFGNSIVTIDEGAFYRCSKLNEVVLQDGVETINQMAFKGCSDLRRMHIPQTVKKIGSQAFKSCKNLQQIELPQNVEVIEADALQGCSSLEKISLGNLVDVVGDEMFKGCVSLQEVTIGATSSVTIENAFVGCKNLKKIYIHEGVYKSLLYSKGARETLSNLCKIDSSAGYYSIETGELIATFDKKEQSDTARQANISVDKDNVAYGAWRDIRGLQRKDEILTADEITPILFDEKMVKLLEDKLYQILKTGDVLWGASWEENYRDEINCFFKLAYRGDCEANYVINSIEGIKYIVKQEYPDYEFDIKEISTKENKQQEQVSDENKESAKKDESQEQASTEEKNSHKKDEEQAQIDNANRIIHETNRNDRIGLVNGALRMLELIKAKNKRGNVLRAFIIKKKGRYIGDAFSGFTRVVLKDDESELFFRNGFVSSETDLSIYEAQRAYNIIKEKLPAAIINAIMKS